MNKAARYYILSICRPLGPVGRGASRQNAQKGLKSTTRRQSGSAFLCHFWRDRNWLVLRSILAEQPERRCACE
jgi:hypothetical protein